MDADVISIETSRSRMELLDAFVRFRYPNGIGPGVYDIHSPRVPDVDEMVGLLDKARGDPRRPAVGESGLRPQDPRLAGDACGAGGDGRRRGRVAGTFGRSAHALTPQAPLPPAG